MLMLLLQIVGEGILDVEVIEVPSLEFWRGYR
jgi:hypothetical protein